MSMTEALVWIIASFVIGFVNGVIARDKWKD